MTAARPWRPRPGVDFAGCTDFERQLLQVLAGLARRGATDVTADVIRTAWPGRGACPPTLQAIAAALGRLRRRRLVRCRDVPVFVLPKRVARRVREPMLWPASGPTA